MEIDILNDLLTESVSKLFNVRSSQQQQNQKNRQIQNTSSTNQSVNISSSSIQSQQSQPLPKQQNLMQNITLESWIEVIGPQKLQESLSSLNIDLNRLTRADLEAMSVEQLNNEKKRVKNELKAYDALFQSIFSRFPCRNEKEPMRPLYIYYKKLKQQIEKKQQNPAPIPQQSRAGNSQFEIQKKIEDLKKTRAELREKLNNFQNEFTQTHNRRIRFHKDIAPVEREYKMYKEIKLEIQRLENLIQNQQRK